MALNEVGLLVYSQGFAMSRDETIIRELAFCIIMRYSNTCYCGRVVQSIIQGGQDSRRSSDQDGAWLAV